MMSAQENDLITRIGSRDAVRQSHAALLAAGGAGRRAGRAAPRKAGTAAGREPGAVPRRAGPLRPAAPALSAPRRRPGVWPARERRPALLVPRLAVRRDGPVPGDAGRAREQPALPQHQAAGLSGGGEQRRAVGLHGPRRAAGVSGLRLLRGARCLHLCFQGAVGVQLAAGAGGRHRPRARLLPAPVLRGRGPLEGLRQAIPRCVDRLRHADDTGDARARPADVSRWSRPATVCKILTTRDLGNGKTHVRVTNQIFPHAITIPLEPGDDADAVARAGR